MSNLLENVNVNLVVPVFIVFALMRIKAVYNVALRLISGLRFFAQKKFAAISKVPASELTPENVIENSIANLNLTMIELDDSMATKLVLQPQLFYDMFEAMVNLALGCMLAYAWSMGFHCALPTTASSCWVVLLMLALAAFTSQVLTQMLILTGWRAKETKIAVIVGFAAFLMFVGQFITGFAMMDAATVTALAVHINALLVQISPTIVPLKLTALVPLVEVGLSLSFGVLTAGLVIPALRYSQALDTLMFGSRSSLTSITDKNMLWMDFMTPLAVAVIFSPFPEYVNNIGFPKAPRDCAYTGSAPVCSNPLPDELGLFANILFAAQLGVGAFMLLTRVLVMKKHLQCFLDSVVRVVSAHLMAVGAGHAVEPTALLLKVKACTDYLMAAATQYLAVPLFVVACILLLHKSSPVGTGVCYTAYRIAGLDSQPLVNSIASAAQFNSSAVALSAGKPYLVTIWQAAAGAQMTGGNLSGTTPLAAIAAFALKMAEIYALPAAVAVSLCRALVVSQSLAWFLLNAATLLVWRYKPELIVAAKTS